MKLLCVIVGAMLLCLAHGKFMEVNVEVPLPNAEARPLEKTDFFICKVWSVGCTVHTMNEVNIMERILHARKMGSRLCGLSDLKMPEGPNRDYYVIPSFGPPGDAFLCKLHYKNGAYASDDEDMKPRHVPERMHHAAN